MRSADATVVDTAKGQVWMQEVDQVVVDAHATGTGPLDHILADRGVFAENIEGKRLGTGVDRIDDRAQIVILDDRKDGTEYFLFGMAICGVVAPIRVGEK